MHGPGSSQAHRARHGQAARMRHSGWRSGTSTALGSRPRRWRPAPRVDRLGQRRSRPAIRPDSGQRARARPTAGLSGADHRWSAPARAIMRRRSYVSRAGGVGRAGLLPRPARSARSPAANTIQETVSVELDLGATVAVGVGSGWPEAAARRCTAVRAAVPSPVPAVGVGIAASTARSRTSVVLAR